MRRLAALFQKSGLSGFFVGLIVMVLLAWLFPFYGTKESALHLPTITTYGVAIIFFFYGLRLSPKKLKAGLGNWRLHLVIQCTTFVLFPCIILVLRYFFRSPGYELLWIGLIYLAALPSTVSSSVVLVSVARGNIPAAIFNASISSLIGIFITPLWMSFFIEQTDQLSEFSTVISKLCLQVLVPVILGLVLHNKLGGLTDRYKTGLRYFDQLIILLIVYSSFCESFNGNMFNNFPLTNIIFLAVGMLLFFLFMFFLMQGLSVLFNFTREDGITLLFCGSKKSLVQGAVMGNVLFPDPAILGVVLLPLMLYHALQLMAGGVIAEKMATDKINN